MTRDFVRTQSPVEDLGSDPDEQQDTGSGLLQVDAEVDAVGPHVHVVDLGQVAVVVTSASSAAARY